MRVLVLKAKYILNEDKLNFDVLQYLLFISDTTRYIVNLLSSISNFWALSKDYSDLVLLAFEKPDSISDNSQYFLVISSEI